MDFRKQNQYFCPLPGPSTELRRTIRSLSSVHDSSVYNAEPGSAVARCSTEWLVLVGITGGSNSIVMRRCRPYDPNGEVGEQRTVEATPPAQEVTSHARAVPFSPFFWHCGVHGPFPRDERKTAVLSKAHI